MTHGATFLKGNYEMPTAREPVRLSRERWGALVASWEYPIIGMYSDGSRFINVTEPRDVDGVIFLPAEYVPLEATRA